MHTNISFESKRIKRATMTLHARKRSAQRAVSSDCIDLIRAFGEPIRAGHGAVRYLMTEAVVDRLSNTLGHFQRLDTLKGAYIVVSEETNAVITVAHSHK